jgi:predicted RNase H-like HicB family nuclease
MQMQYHVIVEQDRAGAFVARCAPLPGCVSQGTTPAEAIANIKDGITTYLKTLADHDKIKCEIEGCKVQPNFYITGIESRRSLFRRSMCEEHARGFLTEFRSKSSIGSGARDAMPGAVCVDYEMFVYHESPEEKDRPAHICLHEVGGRRRFWTNVDSLAWAALLTQIRQQTPPSAVMPVGSAGRLTKPDGQLQAVVVDKLDEADRRFHAKLRVLKGGRIVSVDVRPSDAYILAAIYGVPIFIDENVLQKASDQGEHPSGE